MFKSKSRLDESCRVRSVGSLFALRRIENIMIRFGSIVAILCAVSAQTGIARAQESQGESAAELVPPRLVQSVDPVYPEGERASGRGARVELALTLDAEGRVENAEVKTSGGEAFDQAALEAARRLVFEPARRGAVAIPAKIPFTFAFELAAPSPPAAAPAPVTEKPAPLPAAAAAQPETSGEPSETLEIDVEGERPPREPTKRVLAGEEIQRMPGTNGDALRAVHNMPGVARPPGLDGLLIVRGSAPRDTAVYVDGTNIPIVYHFGGLSSVIPSEMLERIDFYPGNFGPEYGRAMGGAIDVGVRSPKKDGLHGLLQFDLIDGRFMAEGPITDSTRIMLGARRSWMDAWLGPVMREAGVGVSVAPVYYDYQAMVEHDVTRDTTLRLFAFGSDDRMRLTLESPDPSDPAAGGSFSGHTRFFRVQARADTRPNDAIRWTTSVAAGRDGESFALGAIDADTAIFRIDGRSDFRAKLHDSVTAAVGVDVLFGAYDVTWRAPAADFEGDSAVGPLFGRPPIEQTGKGSIVRPAAYALLELTPATGVKLLPSVRVDYAEDTRDTTVDPRFAARYDIVPGDRRTTLKGGAGIYHQPPEPYQSILPFGTPGVEGSRATHYSLGLEQQLSRPLEASVEGFYKDLDGLVVSVPAAGATETGVSYENLGSGRSYGSEFLLRYKPEGRFFGWVAYTVSRSERRDSDADPYHRFQYDQTHILSALGSVKLGGGFQLGARFRYVTGSPYTPVTGGVMDYDAGVYAPIESTARNSARLPAFHQLDVRVDKEWVFSSFKLSAYLDLQNAYNQQNPEAVIYNYDYSKSSTISGLPILPVLGLRGEI
jgi:TonB family protein